MRSYEILSIVFGDFARLISLCTIGTDYLCSIKRPVAGDRSFCLGDDVVAHIDDNEGVMIVLQRLKSDTHIDQIRRSTDKAHRSMGHAHIAPVPRLDRILNSPQHYQTPIAGSHSIQIRRVHHGRQ